MRFMHIITPYNICLFAVYAHLRPVLVRCTCTYTGCARKISRAGGGRGDGPTQAEEPNETGGKKNKRQIAPRVRRRGRPYDSGDGVRESASARTCAFPFKRGVGGRGGRRTRRRTLLPDGGVRPSDDGPAAAAAAAAACSLGLRARRTSARTRCTHCVRVVRESSRPSLARFSCSPSYHLARRESSAVIPFRVRTTRFIRGTILGGRPRR